jgi:hypothetical protein
MVRHGKSKSDEILSKLSGYGYSNAVAEAIWRWYSNIPMNSSKTQMKA